MEKYRVSIMALVFGLSACSDGSSDSSKQKVEANSGGIKYVVETEKKALQDFKTQQIRWVACDPSVLGEYIQEIQTGNLRGRVLCGNMRVPLDYAEPTKGEASVALLKVSAGNPTARLGILTFNPGGPGGDGLNMAARFGKLWAEQANPQNPYGKKLRYLSDSYDLVGFSPRGLGGSTQLYCSSNESYRETKSTGDRSVANVTNMLFNAKLTAQACAENPLTPYINTDATARDMELMRELFDSPKLNYLGYSYGTWLGKWYDSLFPEQVGHMVLDSVMDFTGTFDSNLESLLMGQHRLGSMEAANYGLDSSSEALQRTYLSLDRDIREILHDYLDFQQGARALTAAVGIQKLRATYPGFTLKQLGEKVESYIFVVDDKDLNQEVSTLAKLMLENKLGPVLENQLVQLKPRSAVYQAVMCNDTATNKDANFWITKGDQLAQDYFFSNGGSVTNNPCIYWPESKVQKPPVYNPKSGRILLVQSEWDGQTVVEGARKTFDALPHASLIFVPDVSKHAVFPYDSCVDEPVVEYLSTGKLGSRETRCEMTIDDAGRKKRGLPDAAQAMPSEGAGVYHDPVAAQKTIDKIHAIIQRNSRIPNR